MVTTLELNASPYNFILNDNFYFKLRSCRVACRFCAFFCQSSISCLRSKIVQVHFSCNLKIFNNNRLYNFKAGVIGFRRRGWISKKFSHQ